MKKLLSTLAIACLSLTATADTYTWVGGTGNVNDANAWNDGTNPVTLSTFDASGDYIISGVASDVTNTAYGFSLTTGTLNVSNQAKYYTTKVMKAESATAQINVAAGAEIKSNYKNFLLNNGGTSTVDGSLLQLGKTAFTGGSSMTVNAGGYVQANYFNFDATSSLVIDGGLVRLFGNGGLGGTSTEAMVNFTDSASILEYQGSSAAIFDSFDRDINSNLFYLDGTAVGAFTGVADANWTEDINTAGIWYSTVTMMEDGTEYQMKIDISADTNYRGQAGSNNVNLSLSEVSVPEPATMSLLAVGGVALLRRRKHLK